MVALIVGAAGYAWWTTKEAQRYQSDLGPELRAVLGFNHGTPYIEAGEQGVEVLTIYPDEDGIMQRAGLGGGDIITSHSLTGLYKALHASRGSEVTITVVEGGSGPPLEERATREVTIHVPAE